MCKQRVVSFGGKMFSKKDAPFGAVNTPQVSGGPTYFVDTKTAAPIDQNVPVKFV